MAGVGIGVQREQHPTGDPIGGVGDELGDYVCSPVAPVLAVALGEQSLATVTATEPLSREPHVIEAHVVVFGGAVLDDLQESLAVLRVGRADVRPVEVVAVASCRLTALVDRDEVGIFARRGVVTETRHHVHGVRQGAAARPVTSLTS